MRTVYSPDPNSRAFRFSTYLRQREGMVRPWVGVFCLQIIRSNSVNSSKKEPVRQERSHSGKRLAYLGTEAVGSTAPLERESAGEWVPTARTQV